MMIIYIEENIKSEYLYAREPSKLFSGNFWIKTCMLKLNSAIYLFQSDFNEISKRFQDINQSAMRFQDFNKNQYFF